MRVYWFRRSGASLLFTLEAAHLPGGERLASFTPGLKFILRPEFVFFFGLRSLCPGNPGELRFGPTSRSSELEGAKQKGWVSLDSISRVVSCWSYFGETEVFLGKVR